MHIFGWQRSVNPDALCETQHIHLFNAATEVKEKFTS